MALSLIVVSVERILLVCMKQAKSPSYQSSRFASHTDVEEFKAKPAYTTTDKFKQGATKEVLHTCILLLLGSH